MTPEEKPSSAERIRFNDWLANTLADRGFALAYIAGVDAQMMRQAAQVAEAVAKVEKARAILANTPVAMADLGGMAAMQVLDAALAMLKGTK